MREDIYELVQGMELTTQLTLDIADNKDYAHMVELLSNSIEASETYIDACNKIADLNSYDNIKGTKRSLDNLKKRLQCLNCDKKDTC